MMMKMFHFVSFYGIVILILNHYADGEPYREAKLIITENDQSQTVHLKPSETFLANNNLPIWIVRHGKLFKVDFENVMKELGPFTTYHDRDSSSAAVYFHKRHEFDGIINARYVIKGLSIQDNDVNNNSNELPKVHDIEVKNPILERGVWGHAEKTGVPKQHRVISTYDSEWIGGKLPIEHNITGLSCRRSPPNFFIETLIVIDYKMTNELFHEYFDGVPSVVSYVLTLFNAVDMLFSKLNSPIIKMNIAGIIIENDLILNMAKCYKKVELFKKEIESIDAYCAEESLRAYVYDQRQTVPLDSYDVIIYLTRYPLHEYINDKKTRKKEVSYLAGLTSIPPSGTYEYRKQDGKFRAGVMIADPGFFGSFAIIAHEMVHAFGIADHDERVDMKDGVCCEKLMKPRNGHCSNCLDWSDSTKKRLVSLFKSPDGCIFKNEPRSLYPSGPRRILTADEQCQCYGYESAQDLQKAQKEQMFCWNVMSGHLFGFCNAYLQCLGEDGKIYGAPVPMDGTPCEEHKFSNKVCWNRVCEEIESKK